MQCAFESKDDVEAAYYKFMEENLWCEQVNNDPCAMFFSYFFRDFLFVRC